MSLLSPFCPRVSAALSLACLSVFCGVKSTEFEALAYPETDAEKRVVRVASAININGKRHPIGWHEIARTGQKTKTPDGRVIPYGQLVDRDGDSISDPGPSERWLPGTSQAVVAWYPDSATLHRVKGAYFLLNHQEQVPGALYLTKLKRDPAGNFSPRWTRPLDLSSIEGVINLCAGIVTPWGSHLGGEEYEPDASQFKSGFIAPWLNYEFGFLGGYFGRHIRDSEAARKANPYRYGWIVEATILNAKGETRVEKRYALGRFSHELAYLMPDQKTVYLSDDGPNVGLFLFVADRARDLRRGTLYAARWEQTSAEGAGAANIRWVRLGHASEAELAARITAGLKFGDLFDIEYPGPGESCPAGFSPYLNANIINDDPTLTRREKPALECLRVKRGQERFAAFLETRRYAAVRGATIEFNKGEGLTHDARNNTLYFAAANIGKGMLDKKDTDGVDYDAASGNHIRVKKNKCGAVYGLRLGPGAKDDLSRPIKSAYIAYSMYSAVEGRENPEGSLNECDLNAIANPDNLTFIKGGDQLIIAEDTGDGYRNDSVWAWNVNSKKLTRVATMPYGAEATSVYHIPDLNGFGYLMLVAQHPFGVKLKRTAAKTGDGALLRVFETATFEERGGRVGYIGPLPRM